MLQSLQLTKRHALTPTLPNTYNFFDMLPIPYPQPLPSYTTFSPFSNTLLFCGVGLEIKKMFISLPSNQKTITNLNCLK